ncbi:MAG: hypothetical protein LQ348_004545 [Seirophora lacunosa]|nr:MAG: hypothetical protein LQ348_004545 [Seirophora lacunosa]
MGWLWSSRNPSGSLKPSELTEEIPTDSAPAPPPGSLEPTTDAPAKNADFEALLSSLATTSKPNDAQLPSPASSEPDAASDDRTIKPESLYPTEMSCRAAFDSAFYCQSLGGQINNVYRYGTLRDCRGEWGQFWFCMRANKGFLGDKERENRIMNHYKKREMKYRVGASSEEVWEPRTRMVDSAFDWDLEAAEKAEAEGKL